MTYRPPFNEQEFIQAVLSDEPLIAVLRGQMFIEAAVEDIIRIVATNVDCLFNEMGFYNKVEAARNMGLLNRQDVTALQAVAKLRNNFAHSLERRAITKADDDSMLASMKGSYRIAYENLLEELPPADGDLTTKAQKVAEEQSWPTRFALGAICVVLVGMKPMSLAEKFRTDT